MSPTPPVPAVRVAAVARWLGLAWLIGFAWTAATGPLTHGFAAYVTAARALRGGLLGAWIYDEPRFIDFVQRSLGTDVIDIFGPNAPAMALLFWPLAGWPPAVARSIWLGLSVGAWGWTMRPRWTTPGAAPAPRVVWLAAALLVMPPVWANLRTAQAYLVVAALLASASWCVLRQRDVVGGALVGLALVTNTAGLALGPALAARRHWRALVAMAAVYAGGVLATFGGDGLAAWRRYPSYVVGFAADPRTMVTAYQSTAGLVRHVCVADARWNPAPAAECAPVAWLAPWMLLGGALLVTLWLARRHDRDPRWWMAAALTLSVLLVPAAEEHQYVQLAVPALLVATAQGETRPWWPWLVFVGLLVVPLTVDPEDVRPGWGAVLAYPRLAAAWWLWSLVNVEARAARRATGPAWP
ncbi:MAG: glycosyltransferase family 87 protein [Vicinamibacterales bacterium]